MKFNYGWVNDMQERTIFKRPENTIKLYTGFIIVSVIILLCPQVAVTETDKTGKTVVSTPSENNDASAGETKSIRKAPEEIDKKVIAYYFHGTRRCRTCKKIEALTDATIKSNFKTELGNGLLEWKAVNIDAQENKHFIKDYNLYTRSVVVVNINGGKQTHWKNLERIWQLVNKEENFKQYIKEEVEASLKGE